MRKFKGSLLFPLVFFALGCLFVYTGYSKFGMWNGLKGPSSGAYPVIVGGVLMALSILLFWKVMSERDQPAITKREWLLIAAAIATFACALLIGLLPALALFYLVWLLAVEKVPIKKAVIPFVVVFGVVYIIFVWWMQISFEPGFFANLILG